MYFWDLNGLTEHLSLEKNTETEGFHYFVAAGLLAGFPLSELIVFNKPSTPPTDSRPAILLGFVIGGSLLYFLTRALFRANGGERGKHFLHRTLAVSWVVGVRYLAAFVPGALIVQLITNSGSPEGNLGALIVFLGLAIGFGIFTFIVELNTLKKIHLACDLKASASEV